MYPLADFHVPREITQFYFNSLLQNFLGKEIVRVKLTDGASATDGSIVDKLDNPEVMTVSNMILNCMLFLGMLAESHVVWCLLCLQGIAH